MSYRRCLSTVGHDDVENAICEHGVSISHLLAHMIASSFFSPAGCCLSLSRILLLRRRSNRPSFPCARPTSFRSFTALYAFVSYPAMKKRSSVPPLLGENRVCSSPRRTGYSCLTWQPYRSTPLRLGWLSFRVFIIKKTTKVILPEDLLAHLSWFEK